MKKNLILLVFSFSFIVSYALPYKRASVVKSYRTSMKEKNFVQARQVLIDAMREHSEAASDAQLYRFKLDAINELIGVENRKIYLNSKPDTATCRMRRHSASEFSLWVLSSDDSFFSVGSS